MKDERSHYGAVDKSLWKQQICGTVLISFIVRKPGPIFPLLVGLMAGQARQIKYEYA